MKYCANYLYLQIAPYTLSRCAIVSKRLKISSYFRQRMLATSLRFASTKHLYIIRTVGTGAWGWGI